MPANWYTVRWVAGTPVGVTGQSRVRRGSRDRAVFKAVQDQSVVCRDGRNAGEQPGPARAFGTQCSFLFPFSFGELFCQAGSCTAHHACAQPLTAQPLYALDFLLPAGRICWLEVALRAVVGLALAVCNGDSEGSMWEHRQASFFCKQGQVRLCCETRLGVITVSGQLAPQDAPWASSDPLGHHATLTGRRWPC